MWPPLDNILLLWVCYGKIMSAFSNAKIRLAKLLKGPEVKQVKLKFNLYHMMSFFIKLFNLKKLTLQSSLGDEFSKLLHFLLGALSKWNPQPVSCLYFVFLMYVCVCVYTWSVQSWELLPVCKHWVLGSTFFQRKIAVSELIKMIFCHNELLWHKKVQTGLF